LLVRSKIFSNFEGEMLEDQNINFDKTSKEILNESKREIIENFTALEKVTKNIDPICLLSQLVLSTLGYSGEAKIFSERKLEFLSGFLVTHPYNENTQKLSDYELMDKVDEVVKTLDKYFHAINSYLLFLNKEKVVDNFDDKEELILKHAKISSFWIRGDAFPHQLIKYALDLYSKHDLWFKKKLGFTIKEAVIVYNAIFKLYEKRFYRYQNTSKKESKDWVKIQISNKVFSEAEAKAKEKNVNIFYLFSKSAKIFTFTIEELANFSSMSIETCNKIMSRLSQSFGYRNPKFKSTYLDPFNAPWDYNTLYERPIIKYQEKYFVPLLPIFPTVLFYSFYFDILLDEEYLEKYNEILGKWLEEKTYQVLRNVFPKNEIYLNPEYPNRKELSDVLILHDRNILIIQCKSKKLTYEARIGSSIDKLKEDLKQSVKESFDQALKAKNYLKESDYPEIILKNKKTEIDMQQVDNNNIFLISVTLGQFANITTRLANINPTLKLFSSNEYPWAVCLFDLEIIAELLKQPFYFIHYLIKRLNIEKTNFHLEADEIDLLGYYLDQKLNFDREEFKSVNQDIPFFIALGGFSKLVDDFMIKKYQLKENPPKPIIKIPNGFKDLIFSIDKLDTPYRTHCILRLLDLRFIDQENLLKSIKYCKNLYTRDDKLSIFSISVKDMNLEIIFISMNANSNFKKLFEEVEYFSLLKKYRAKFRECIGFGWDRCTKNIINVVFYASFPWIYNPELEEFCEKNLKEGKIITFNNMNI
jgi:hypothetical protein